MSLCTLLAPPSLQSWPEATDPYKFVYEDISIAAYLLVSAVLLLQLLPLLTVQVLWEQEREELGLQHRQSFIDLGCGNGLLVYLLSAEGVSSVLQCVLTALLHSAHRERRGPSQKKDLEAVWRQSSAGGAVQCVVEGLSSLPLL